jgi:HK97 gp10 family phage protein
MSTFKLQIKNNSDIFKDAKDEAVETALDVVGMTAEGYAVMKCPVDTGRLRNSITHTVKDGVAYIGTNVEYASYVELGTVNPDAGRHTENDPGPMAKNPGHVPNHNPQPFLKPAVVDHVNEYKDIIKRVLTTGDA